MCNKAFVEYMSQFLLVCTTQVGGVFTHWTGINIELNGGMENGMER